MTDTVRDDLLAVSMDTLLYVDNIPVGLISSGFFEVKRDDEVIEQIKERVELCREYYETLYNFL